jgi:hypothetical protein
MNPKDEPITPELHAPEIHAAIGTALHRRAAARRRRSPLRLPRRLGLPILVVILLGGTALAAATTPWAPILGDDDVGHPTVATSPLPPDQVAALGVLSRPQGAADRSPAVENVLAQLPEQEVGGIHVDGVRLLAQRADGASVLVPMERVGSDDPGSTSSMRTNQLCLLYGWRSTIASDGIQRGVSEMCGSAEDLRAGRIGGSSRGGDGRMHQSGLVPDGVVRVELTLRDGSTITADVHNNYFEAPLGSALPSKRPSHGSPNTAGSSTSDLVVNAEDIRWLDADGNEVPKA